MKLEELIASMHDCEQYTNLISGTLVRDPAMQQKNLDADDPINGFDTLGDLYSQS